MMFKIISIIDIVGVPDLSIDEKATASLGLLLFREEYLLFDSNLNSAERIQTNTKIVAEHILQMVNYR